MQSEIISRHVNSVIGRRMTWGQDDCVLFVAGLVKDIAGIDVLGNAWRGRWTGEAEAQEALPLGLGVTVGRRMRELGWKRCTPHKAPMGAIAIVRGANKTHGLGMMLGTGWVVCRGEKGAAYLPASHVAFCWEAP